MNYTLCYKCGIELYKESFRKQMSTMARGPQGKPDNRDFDEILQEMAEHHIKGANYNCSIVGGKGVFCELVKHSVTEAPPNCIYRLEQIMATQKF